MDEILGYVTDALVFMNRWLRRHVHGFTGFSEDELRGYSTELAYRIETGQCRCGGVGCGNRHSRAGFGTTGVRELRRFVWDAVIGPRGRRAGSLAQGMLYRLILRRTLHEAEEEDRSEEVPGHNQAEEAVPGQGVREKPRRMVQRHSGNMLLRLVELKCCPTCRRRYELLSCDAPGCLSPFDPTTTRVIGSPRLILPREYSRVRRWGCADRVSGRESPAAGSNSPRRRRGPRPDHYYQQDQCRESLNVPSSPRPLRVHHRTPHDCCPLRDCSRKQRHPERGTCLWVRHQIAQQPGSHTPIGWGVVRRWTRQRLRRMEPSERRNLRATIRAEPDAPPGRLDLLEIGRRLLTRVYSGVWSEEQRLQAIEEVREALANYGFDLDASDDD